MSEPKLAPQGVTIRHPTLEFHTSARGGGFGQGEFTPLSLTDLEAWYDPNDLSTVNYGIEPAVASIEDKSGKGNTAEQLTVVDQPDLVQDVINGKHVLRFDASQWMEVAYAAGLNPTSTSVFTVQETNDALFNSGSFTNRTATDGGISLYFGTNQKHTLIITDSIGTSKFINQPQAAILGSFYMIAAHNTDPDAHLYRNGQLLKTLSTAVNLSYGSNHGIRIGGGVNYNAGTTFNGDIAEITFMSTEATVQERANMVSYHQTKHFPIVDPTTLSELIGYWTADAGLTLDGADVDQWDDQGPNGLDWIATLTEEPQYNATGLNGMPTIDFQALHEMTIADNDAFDSSTGYDIFVVINKDASSTAGTIIRSRTNGAFGTVGLDGIVVEYDTADRNIMGFQDVDDNYQSVVNTGLWPEDTPFLLTVSLEPTTMTTFHNSVDQVETVVGSGTVGSVIQGTDMHLGNNPSAARRLDAQISAIVMCKKLSDANRIKVENFLRFKWGV